MSRKIAIRTGGLTLAVLALMFASALPVAGFPGGELDPTFGVGGKATVDFGGTDTGFAVAIQGDGKIVVAGGSLDGDSDFAVVRHNADGSLDTGFGSSGKVTTDFGGSEIANAVAIDGNDNILLAGNVGLGFGVIRHSPDGTLDTGFGTGGLTSTDFGFSDVANAMAIQTNGKIVVAGHTGSLGNVNIAMARYNTDGSLDATFGTGGKVVSDFGGSEFGTSMAIQKDGKIIVAGFAGDIFGFPLDYLTIRYNTDGTLDNSFGTAGRAVTDIGGDDEGRAVSIQANGKIVLAGTSNVAGGGDFALARLNNDGTPDSTFGVGSITITDFSGGEIAYSVATLGDGRIVAAGWSSSASGNDFAVARYRSDGSLDPGFGTGGLVTTDFGDAEPGLALAIQTDQKIVVAGLTEGGGDRDFAIARYLGGIPGGHLEPVIEFVSRNGDTAPFNTANVGDIVVFRVSVSGQGSSTVAVLGKVSLKLGNDTLELGTINETADIEFKKSKPLNLIPNTSLSGPAVLLDDGLFQWTVRPPSPFVQSFVVEIPIPGANPPASSFGRVSLAVGGARIPNLTTWGLLAMAGLLAGALAWRSSMIGRTRAR
jgi:uncharacterized delta-60 repeat protein